MFVRGVELKPFGWMRWEEVTLVVESKLGRSDDALERRSKVGADMCICFDVHPFTPNKKPNWGI